MKYLLYALLLASCCRKVPKVIYQDKYVTKIDTVTVSTHTTDSIPCDDFEVPITNGKDTVYVKVVDKQLEVKYIKKSDTIYRETNERDK